jgi:hypothetical protein
MGISFLGKKIKRAAFGQAARILTFVVDQGSLRFFLRSVTIAACREYLRMAIDIIRCTATRRTRPAASETRTEVIIRRII